MPPQPRPQPQPQPAQRRPPTLLDLPAGCITNVGSYLTKTNAGLAAVGLTASVGSWVSAGRAGRNPRPNDLSIAMLAAFERYPAEALREISRDNLVKIVRMDDGMTGKWNWNPVAGRRRGHVMVRTQTNQCYLAPDGGGWTKINTFDLNMRLKDKLRDDDIMALLLAVDAHSSLRSLTLTGLRFVTGSGLTPIRGSTVIEKIDLDNEIGNDKRIGFDQDGGVVDGHDARGNIDKYHVMQIINSILHQGINAKLKVIVFPMCWSQIRLGAMGLREPVADTSVLEMVQWMRGCFHLCTMTCYVNIEALPGDNTVPEGRGFINNLEERANREELEMTDLRHAEMNTCNRWYYVVRITEINEQGEPVQVFLKRGRTPASVTRVDNNGEEARMM